MYILLRDNNIVGVTVTENVPDGYTIKEYSGEQDINKLYYEPASESFKLIPPRPEPVEGFKHTWVNNKWVTTPIQSFRPPVKENYMGSALYKWAATSALTDARVLLLHCTAMCSQIADVDDIFINTIKELRAIRSANAS